MNNFGLLSFLLTCVLGVGSVFHFTYQQAQHLELSQLRNAKSKIEGIIEIKEHLVITGVISNSDYKIDMADVLEKAGYNPDWIYRIMSYSDLEDVLKPYIKDNKLSFSEFMAIDYKVDKMVREKMLDMDLEYTYDFNYRNKYK